MPLSPPPSETRAIGPMEAFWRFRGWTVPVTVVVALLTGVLVLATSGTSTASTTLFLTDPRGTPVFRDGSSTPTDLERYARQRAEFADSATIHADVVAALAAAGVGGVTVETVDDAVTTGTTASADVRIACTHASEQIALAICDATVDAYLDRTAADTRALADATVDAFLEERSRLVDQGGGQSTIDQIDLQIAEVRSEAALFGDGVEFVEPAEVDEDARILPALQYTLAALLFAAFATAIIAWFRAGRRPVVASSSDATGALQAPLLGEITERPAGHFDPTSPPGAAYQLLATSLGAVQPGGGVVLTASAVPSQHGSETAARLAVAAAREGRRVLVVDANLRDRRVSTLFGFEHAVGGLTELLAGLTSLDEVRRIVGVGGEASLDLVTGGRAVDDPAGLLRSQHARAAMQTLRGRYQLIVVDVPPLLDVADGSALAGDADGVVVLVERGTETADLDIVRQRLDVLRARLVGVVYDHHDRGG